MNYLAPFTCSPGDFSSENTMDSHSIFMLNDAYKAVDSCPNGWAILARTDVPGTRACLYCSQDVSRKPSCHICGGSGTVECGFMFDSHTDPLVASTIEEINKKLDGGHSGSSYGWTMRNMEAIAKKGWEVFMLGWRLSHLKRALENRNLSHDEQVKLHGIKFKLERMILNAEANHKNAKNAAAAPAAPAALSASANPVVTVLQQAHTLDTFFNTQAAQNATDPLAFANAARNDPGMRAMIPDIDQQADAMTRFARGQMSYAEMRGLCG